MSENWHQLYTELTDFITSHTEIKIEPYVVRIHETVRPEFYRLFWATREAFIRERHKTLIDAAETLSREYLQVEEEIIKLIGLERIVLFPRVNNFLHNPIDVLTKELHKPLFNLLKGRIGIESYEKEASSISVSYFDLLFQKGYEIWMVLSLIKLLEADKTFRVDADDFDENDAYRHGGGTEEVMVGEPEELKQISFKHNDVIGILVADQIVHSARLGYYFSFRPHIVEPDLDAINKSKKREWLPLPVETIINMGSNVILVYTDKELDELSIIADSRTICRPDLIIECVGLEKLFGEKSLAKTRKCNEDFKPKLGTYIISNRPLIEKKIEDKGIDSVPNEPAAERIPEEEDIHFLPIGFDQSKLEQVINLFNKENNGIMRSDKYQTKRAQH